MLQHIYARVMFAPRSEFGRAVAERGRRAIAYAGDHRFADARVWLQAAVVAVGVVAAYAALLSGALSASASTLCAVVAAAFAFMLAVVLGHDSTHGSVSRSRRITRLVTFATFGIMGVSGALWRDRHIRLHHQLPNVAGTGIDADGFAMMRLSPRNAWRPIYRWQALYSPLAYAVGLLHLVWFEDFAMLHEARQRDPAFRTWSAAFEFAATKILHITLFLVVPALVLAPDPLFLAGAYALAMATASVVFVTITMGTHISDLADYPVPDADGWLAHDWATHQLLTSVDWAPESVLAVAAVGGANAHAAHHLFPNVSHRHLPRLSRIVAEEAARHGVPHHKVSLAESLRGHWRLVVGLGRRPT